MGQELINQILTPAIVNAVEMWAQATTDTTSLRYAEAWQTKARVIARFLVYVNKHPLEVTEQDVAFWRSHLEESGLAPVTVYALLSRLSSFYEWAMQDERLGQAIARNPVNLVRPKAPKPYQSEGTKSLMDHEFETLMDYVKRRADSGDVVGKRDYALLYLYFVTGLRRSEIIRLHWRDFQIADSLILHIRVKGGEHKSIEVRDMDAATAVFDYLEASNRQETIQEDDHLWTSHDRANMHPGGQLTSHAFVKNLKRYALEAGLGDIHLHQTRHTYGRIVAEETGSMVETQNALGHKHRKTTEVYVQRVGIKRDKYSQLIFKRIRSHK